MKEEWTIVEEGKDDMVITIDDWYKMNHHDWRYVVNEHNDLLAEVKRLREQLGDFKHPKQMIDNLHRPVLKIPIDSLQYVDALKEGQAFLMIEKNGKTWVWDGMIMEG